jgi:ribosomal protein S18 acetylase RimI-like enzyme
MEPGSIHLTKLLNEQPPLPTWPDGVRLRPFDPVQDPRELHALLVAAYEVGGGSVEQFEEWWPSLRDDDEFDSSLVFIVIGPDGRMVAAAHCWVGGFIKDLAVAKGWRRRGMGEALLLHVFRTFKERGAVQVALKVEGSNPWSAERLYRRIGMMPVQ